MTVNKILLIGSLAYDHLLRYPNQFKQFIAKRSRINASFVLDQKLVSRGGCGDVCRAGFFGSLMQALDMDECVLRAMYLAGLCLGSAITQEYL